MAYESKYRPCHSVWSDADAETLEKAVLAVDPDATFEDGNVGYSYPYGQNDLLCMIAEYMGLSDECEDTAQAVRNILQANGMDIRNISARMLDYDREGYLEGISENVKGILEESLARYVLEEHSERKAVFRDLDFKRFEDWKEAQEMNSYEEKQEARRERYRGLAAAARAESRERNRKAHSMAEAIPFGQPILVGHHSERRDRAYRAKIGANIDKSVELLKKAEYYEGKADSVGKGGISSDDPEAIEKLREKLKRLRDCQERMKSANRSIRMKDVEKGNEKLRDLGYTDEQIAELRKGDFCGRIGFASYMLSNNNANIHRIENRIRELERRKEREEQQETVTTELYEYRIEDNRCQFIFDGKPNEEIRGILKGHGFKWSPTRIAWVRQASGNGIYASNVVMKALDALTGRRED